MSTDKEAAAIVRRRIKFARWKLDAAESRGTRFHPNGSSEDNDDPDCTKLAALLCLDAALILKGDKDEEMSPDLIDSISTRPTAKADLAPPMPSKNPAREAQEKSEKLQRDAERLRNYVATKEQPISSYFLVCDLDITHAYLAELLVEIQRQGLNVKIQSYTDAPKKPTAEPLRHEWAELVLISEHQEEDLTAHNPGGTPKKTNTERAIACRRCLRRYNDASRGTYCTPTKEQPR